MKKSKLISIINEELSRVEYDNNTKVYVYEKQDSRPAIKFKLTLGKLQELIDARADDDDDLFDDIIDDISEKHGDIFIYIFDTMIGDTEGNIIGSLKDTTFFAEGAEEGFIGLSTISYSHAKSEMIRIKKELYNEK